MNNHLNKTNLLNNAKDTIVDNLDEGEDEGEYEDNDTVDSNQWLKEKFGGDESEKTSNLIKEILLPSNFADNSKSPAKPIASNKVNLSFF